MRKFKPTFFAAALAAVLAQAATAQEISVTYSARVNTASQDLFKEAGLPEEMRAALVNAYRDIEFAYALDYSGSESTFRMVPSGKKQQISFMGQAIDLSEMEEQQAANVTYKNHSTKETATKVEFLGKVFLIVDTIADGSFQTVEGETKDILGFECKKAVSDDGKQTVWITEHIPVNDGPVDTGLPGLVMEACTDEYIYTATSVDEGVKHTVEAPKGGKRVTKAEFEDMVLKQTEMMQRGSGGW